jgi:long-chain acyl-CoA synthetase
MPILEGYGLTETAPIISINGSSEIRIGSVGKPLDKLTVVIEKPEDSTTPEGEIIVYGPSVMKEYWNKPEDTKKVLKSDGGLYTGDRGKFDADGYLYITGRSKEEYKLANGKYCHPTEVEKALKSLPYFSNCMVFGDGKEYNVILAIPNGQAIEDLKNELKLSMPINDILRLPQVINLIMKAVQQHLSVKFEGYEIPKKISFIEEEFSVENSLLTQTLKLNRKLIIEKYKDIILKMYDE